MLKAPAFARILFACNNPALITPKNRLLAMSSLAVQKMVCHQPPLTEVAEALQAGLSANFATVQVKVVDCPDLSKAPFHLADKGLCGQARLADIGGVDHLMPLARRDKNYDLKNILDLCEMPGSGLMIGAGGGPNDVIGTNCELICNARFGGQRPCDKTKIAKVQENGSYQQLESDCGKFSMMGNFLVSNGQPGKVIEVKVTRRTGQQKFVDSLISSLAQRFGDQQAVGLGGTFLLQAGKARVHVMPDFMTEAMETNEQVNNWLKFYEMDAPLVNVGEVVSADPQGLHLRKEHFHCFSEHGQAGHYHYDTTPETVSYLGYFTVAETIFRIDRPSNTKHVF